MPTTKITGPEWATETLAADEMWQARDGRILTTVEAVAADDQGIELVSGAVRTFAAGVTVNYRAPAATAAAPVLLAREAT